MELHWLQNRHVLLDTNVLINYSKSKGELKPFFELIKRHHCPAIITDAVYFEFIRAAKTKAELAELHELIGQFIVLPTTKQDIEAATEISILCSARSKDHAARTSFVDNLLGAQLKCFGKNILLATSDLGDFPLDLYTRKDVRAFDLGKSVITIGFIEYDEEKATNCRDTFERKST